MATLFDGVVFTIMGAAIVVQTLSTVAVAVALWRQQFADRALGWALRLGMTMTIVGALTGGLMTRPTPQQLDTARAGERMTVAGAHTVGGPDGGPGLPGTGWSTDHGDLRVAHFLGLHALQALPILALVLARRRVSDLVRLRLTIAAAASYMALFGILLSQALRAQPVLAPDALTIALLSVWAFVTVAGAAVFGPILSAQVVAPDSSAALRRRNSPHISRRGELRERQSQSSYFFAPSVISRRRPLAAGGAGIVISSTPSRKFAFACSVIAPSGSGTTR